jgi:hypothetical protein
MISHGGDLEWATWAGHEGGRKSLALPAHIRVKNCGYVPPPDKNEKTEGAGNNLNASETARESR